MDATADEVDAAAWADHVRNAARAGSARRICVAMATVDAEASREEKGLRRRLWADFVGPLDGRVLVERQGTAF